MAQEVGCSSSWGISLMKWRDCCHLVLKMCMISLGWKVISNLLLFISYTLYSFGMYIYSSSLAVRWRVESQQSMYSIKVTHKTVFIFFINHGDFQSYGGHFEKLVIYHNMRYEILQIYCVIIEFWISFRWWNILWWNLNNINHCTW